MNGHGTADSSTLEEEVYLQYSYSNYITSKHAPRGEAAARCSSMDLRCSYAVHSYCDARAVRKSRVRRLVLYASETTAGAVHRVQRWTCMVPKAPCRMPTRPAPRLSSPRLHATFPPHSCLSHYSQPRKEPSHVHAAGHKYDHRKVTQVKHQVMMCSRGASWCSRCQPPACLPPGGRVCLLVCGGCGVQMRSVAVSSWCDDLFTCAGIG